MTPNIVERDTLLSLAEPLTVHRWAIIGPYGNIWTPTLFDKPEQAEDHLRGFWGRQGFSDGYFAAAVEVTIREISSTDLPRVPLVCARKGTSQ